MKVAKWIILFALIPSLGLVSLGHAAVVWGQDAPNTIATSVSAPEPAPSEMDVCEAGGDGNALLPLKVTEPDEMTASGCREPVMLDSPSRLLLTTSLSPGLTAQLSARIARALPGANGVAVSVWLLDEPRVGDMAKPAWDGAGMGIAGAGRIVASDAAAIAVQNQRRVFDAGTPPPEVRAITSVEYSEFLRLNDLAVTLGNASDFDGEIKARNQQLEIAYATYGRTHPAIAVMLCSQAVAYIQLKDTIHARQVADQAKAIIVKTWGANSFEYAYILSIYGRVSSVEGNAADTEGYLAASVTLFDGLLKTTPDAINSLPNLVDYYYYTLVALAAFYNEVDDADNAILIWQRALVLCQQVFGPDGRRTQAITAALKAEITQRDLLREQEMQPSLVARMPFTSPFGVKVAFREPSLEDLKEILALNQLASAAAARSDFVKAAGAYEAILPIYSRTLGPEHPENVYPLLAAAVSWTSAGEFGKASQRASEGADLARKTFGETSLAYGAALNVRATVSMAMGKFESAEADYAHSLDITDRLRGPDFLGGLEALEGLAGLNVATGDDLAKAIVLFDRAIDIRTRNLPQDSQGIIAVLVQKAQAYRDLGRSAEAESTYLRAQALSIRSSGVASIQTSNVNRSLGDFYVETGRLGEAERLLSAVLDVREKGLGKNASETLEALSDLTGLYNAQHRPDKAKPLLLRAIGAQEALLKKTSSRDPRRLLSVLNLMGLYLQNGEIDKAMKLRRQNATEFLRFTEGSSGIQAFLQSLTVVDLLAAGRAGEAQKLIEELLPSIEQAYGANSHAAQLFLDMLTTTRLLNNDLAGAEQAGQRNIVSSEALFGRLSKETAQAYSLLAAIQVRKGDPGRALETAGIAVEVERSLRARLRPTSGPAANDAALDRAMASLGQASDAAFAFATWLEAAWALEPDTAATTHGDAAFQVAQDVLVTPSGQSLALAAARTHGTRPQADLAKQYEELAASVHILDLRLAKALGRQDDAAALAIRTQLSSQTSLLIESDAKLAKTFPAYSSLIHPRALSVSEVQAMLAPDQAVVLLLASGIPAVERASNPFVNYGKTVNEKGGDDDHVDIFVVSKSGFTWKRIAGAFGRSEQRIASLLCDVDAATCEDATLKTETEGFDLAAAYGIYKDTLEPVEAALKGVKRLFVVTPGIFGALPLNLLVTSDPSKTPMSMATAPWLADRFAMTVLPSISNLSKPRTASVTSTGPIFSGYGAPLLTGDATASRSGDVDAEWFVPDIVSGRYLANPNQFKRLASLPGTAAELQKVAAALGVRDPKAINVGALDDEARFKSDASLKTAKVISIATHGILPPTGDLVIEPSLVFTPPLHGTSLNDGLLTATEVMSLNFTADWIVLSACNTAVSNDQGDSLSGLSRAFLFAGAQSVLAAHWRISDEATAQLISTTLTLYGQGRLKGLTKSEALQRSMQAVRKDPRFVHPRYWASFTTISGIDN